MAVTFRQAAGGLDRRRTAAPTRLDIAAEQHHGGDRDEGRGEDREDAELDALERPVAARGLVGDEPVEAAQGRPAGRRDPGGAPRQRLAGGREGPDGYA